MRKFSQLLIVALIMILGTSFVMQGASGPKKHLGIATYSVKGIESDVEGSFKALADDGYEVVEISNYNPANGTVAGFTPADYAKIARKYGLEIISSHARGKFDVKDVDGTLASWGKVFDDHKAMGCKYVVLPMNMWANNVEGLKAECALMNKIGEEANKRGLKFGYHNHSMEFATVPGTDQFFEDFLIANTDPDKVFFQMDVYWTIIGGQDPVAYMKKYPDRIKVLHIKDDYVIGESGTIDYKPIFEQFYKNGYQDWFVEMESKMTPEQKKQMMGMMEMMKKRMSQGGGNPMGQPPAGQQGGNPPKGGQGNPPQGGQANQPQGGQGQRQGQMPGMGPRDPKVVAEQLKTSLEGLKQSADFLLKADYVK
jgi:sugar phosphate isomerase/epimerase